jgi:dihydrodipicolinate reductase
MPTPGLPRDRAPALGVSSGGVRPAGGDHRLRVRGEAGRAERHGARAGRAHGEVRRPEIGVPVAKTLGQPEARGAELWGSQVHSLRLPGFVLGAEVIFGMPDQTLMLRHNAGSSAKVYVDGALLAIGKVSTLVRVHRG